MKLKKYLLQSFLIYLVFYLLIFAQFPLNNTIGGTCDTLLTIVSSNYLGSWISCLLNNLPHTSSLYPVENIFQWGESAIGFLLTYNFFSLLGFNDVFCWYFYDVLVFTLNGFGIFLLVYYYSKNFFISILGGFLFSCTNFAFANIDDVHILFYFFTALSVVLLLRYKETERKRLLILAAFFCALQVYFSLYIFVYGSVVFVVFLMHIHNYFRKINYHKIKSVLLCIGVYIIVVAPFIIFYIRTTISPEFSKPEMEGWNNIISSAFLRPNDFFNVMPNNLIYSSLQNDYELFFSFFEIRKSAFIGTLFLSLGIFFSIKDFKNNIPWILIFILGFLLSSFPYKFLTTYLPFFEIVRLPYRAFYISVFALSVIVSLGLANTLKNIDIKKQLFIIGMVLLIHFVENIPYPFPLSNHEKVQSDLLLNKNISLGYGFQANNLKPSENLVEIIDNNTSINSVILCLPSNRIFGGEIGMLTYNRELIYMNHQTFFKRNVFNGVHGYIPKSRIEIQSHVENLPNKEDISFLIAKGLTHVIFYKNLILDKKDDILSDLKKSNNLKLINETNDFAVFNVCDF